ncbi:pumilio homolog 12-like [Olea europaea var. sylvestris]|uniref:pumilio homolog 12-like n=1 Tax=Olea europaea var. sylvestris TaxID=158386 RepID=UPI000C1D0428|nr:pumilio homolog 12-like [Olea europaea var. sylvestris]
MGEDCERSSVNNNKSRISAPDSRNLEMTENNQLHDNGVFLPNGDWTNGLSSLPENNPFEFPQTESNSYHVGFDGSQNLAMRNTNGQVNVNAGGGGGNIYRLPSLPENLSFQVSQLENNTYYPGVDSRQSLAMMNTGGDQVNSAAAGQIYGLPSLPGNNPLQVPPQEISTYNPVDGRQTLGMMNTNGRNVNPSNVDPFYDFPLESQFSRLTMSTNPSIFTLPSSYGRGTAVGGGGSRGRIVPNNLTLGMGAYSQSQLSYGDLLQRMRIQSAARGQNMDLYTQPRNYSSFDDGINEIASQFGLNSIALSNYDRSFTGESIRYPTRPRRIGSLLPSEYGSQTSSNRNGQRLDTNGSIETNNYSSLLTSRLRPSFSSLEDLRGNILSAAKEQQGCRFLQMIIEEGKQDHIQMIFSEVKDHVSELMINQFGSCLIQKLFEVCSQEQMDELLILVMQDERTHMAICVNIYGTRAMQKLLEHLKTGEQKSTAISCIARITVPLTKSLSGHHVIQHVLKFFSAEDNKHILNAVADNCAEIATDKSGCCVIQQCVAHARGESRDRLLQEIIINASDLSVHPYGNYVVQYVLGLRIPRVTKDILNRLSGNFTQLSMSKYGSNVVEKCLKESPDEEASRIVQELSSDPQWLMVIQNPFGNYVAQSALEVSKGAIRAEMVNFINHHYPFLNSHPHGKRVLARTRGNKNRG